VSLFGTQFFVCCACDRTRLNHCLCLFVLSDTYCTVVKTSWISLFYRVIGLYNMSRLNKYLSFVVLSDIQLFFYLYGVIKYNTFIVKFSVAAMHAHYNTAILYSELLIKMTSWILENSVRIFLKLSLHLTVLKPSSSAHIHTFLKLLQTLHLHHQTVHCHANNSHTLDSVLSLSNLLHTIAVFQYSIFSFSFLYRARIKIRK